MNSETLNFDAKRQLLHEARCKSWSQCYQLFANRTVFDSEPAGHRASSTRGRGGYLTQHPL